jgi:hypothetical protein
VMRRGIITKRASRRMALLLLAGAMINVAVAWTSAICVRIDNKTVGALGRAEFLSSPAAPCWNVTVLRSSTAARFIYVLRFSTIELYDESGQLTAPIHENNIPDWSEAHVPSRLLTMNQYRKPGPGETVPDVIVEDARGWPWLSLQCEHAVSMSRLVQAPFVSGIVGGIPIGMVGDTAGAANWPPAWWYSRALPLRPLWPGFAINTLFYAALCWLAFFVPFALRRRHRRRRGLCPACAYPVGRSGLCTECGAAVPPRRGAGM